MINVSTLKQKENSVVLRGCPRCYGDLLLNRDGYGRYFSCFQCGYHSSADEEQPVARPEAIPQQQYGIPDEMAS